MSTKIKVQYVDPPKEGSQFSSWSVKDANGNRYYADAAVGQAIIRGEINEVEIVNGTSKAGKAFQKITKVITGGQQQLPKTAGQAAARVVGRHADDDPTPERIYVCGIVNASIHSQQVIPTDPMALIAVTDAARSAWAATFGGKTRAIPETPHSGEIQRPLEPGFDDEIVF